jgi:cytidine deaminase
MNVTMACPAEVHSRLRVALVAPSGSGKSTVADLLKQHFETQGLSVAIIKLADPLYRLQASFYEVARRRISEKAQNQSLLEQIATSLRRINPASLVEDFGDRLSICTADVVINDDLRDYVTDWPYLREQGFQVVRVVAEPELRRHRLGVRNDPVVVLKSSLDRQMERIPANFLLENNGSFETVRLSVEWLANELLMGPSHRVQAFSGIAR